MSVRANNSYTAPPPNCNAQFSYQVDATNPLLIHFTDLSSGSIALWTWDFGDGNISYYPNPSHTYAATGTYQVSLIISDSNSSCTDTTSLSITVSYNQVTCQANYGYLADTSNALLIHFIDSSSTNITSWNWNFGDGGSSNLQNPSHTYASAGSYNVELIVSDSIGSCSDTITKTVNVIGSSTCHAIYSYSANTNNSLHISFSDQSQGNPYMWHWDFGDGNSSTLQNPTHTYAQSGNYTVSLNITTQNCNDSTSQQITVLPNSNTGSLLVYVFADSNYLDSGLVFLYQYDSLFGGLYAVDSTYATYSQNIVYYNFPNIPQGYYRVYAKILNPNGIYGSYYNTWAPNKYNWQNADSVLVNSNNVWTTIQLAKSTVSYPSGNGSISGTISKKANGSTLPSSGIDVYLLLNDSNIISKTTTDQQGTYIFKDLAFGTYYIHPELTGKHTHNKKVILNFNIPNIDTASFLIDGDQILADINTEFQALSEIQFYPNPVKNTLFIQSHYSKNMTIEIQLMDISGRVLLVEKLNLFPESKNNIDFSKLSNGLYFITIRSNTYQITKKIIKH
jgi:PKD repeat protein